METQVWTGKRTLYELIAENTDGRRVLIQYTTRKGIKDMYHALQDQKDYIAALFGTLNFERLDTPRPQFRFNSWTVRFTGRTQRDALRSESPFIRDYCRETGIAV
jgi:hypothetical protein